MRRESGGQGRQVQTTKRRAVLKKRQQSSDTHSLFPNAVPRPHTERLHHLPPIPRVPLPPHPPLRVERLRVRKVGRRVVGRVLVQLHARAGRDVVPGDVAASRRDLAGLALQRGRIHAEGLVEHGLEEGQFGQCSDGEGRGRGAGGADLAHEAGVVRRVGEQQVQRTGEDARRGLPARDDQRGGVALDLGRGHALVVGLA